jgi:hypothetical protein
MLSCHLAALRQYAYFYFCLLFIIYLFARSLAARLLAVALLVPCAGTPAVKPVGAPEAAPVCPPLTSLGPLTSKSAMTKRSRAAARRRDARSEEAAQALRELLGEPIRN